MLADLEAGEAGQRDAGLVHELLDGLLGVGDGRLLQEDDVLEGGSRGATFKLVRASAESRGPIILLMASRFLDYLGLHQ